MCPWWNNYFLSFFPTFLLPFSLFPILLFFLFVFFQFFMCRMALWLYILFRKVSTWGLYDHLVRVLCSWRFLIWLYLGKDILSSTPALKKQPPSRYLTVSCSRTDYTLAFSFLQYVYETFWGRNENHILERMFFFLHSVYSFLTITLP